LRLILGQLNLASSGGKAVHPLPGVKSKPGPLDPDFYKLLKLFHVTLAYPERLADKIVGFASLELLHAIVNRLILSSF
jgi:hypothetical protein